MSEIVAFSSNVKNRRRVRCFKVEVGAVLKSWRMAGMDDSYHTDEVASKPEVGVGRKERYMTA